jgi:phage baseplate assembly protein W
MATNGRFRGVDFPFQPSINGTPKGAEDAVLVRANLIQILNTRPGERRMHPEFGIDLISLVFESLTQPEVVSLARDRILRAVTRFEPRARVLDLGVATQESRLDIILRYEFNSEVSDLQLQIGTG